MKNQTITVDGQTIFYREAGDKEKAPPSYYFMDSQHRRTCSGTSSQPWQTNSISLRRIIPDLDIAPCLLLTGSNTHLITLPRS